MKVPWILFFVGLAAVVGAQDCNLTKSIIENEKRLFTIRTGNGLELLTTNTVPHGSTLHLVCDDVTYVGCQYGQFNVSLPLVRCLKFPNATVETITDPACNAETYRVGYKVQSHFLELYRTCYNKSQVRAFMAFHYTHFSSISTNRPNKTFTTDRIITGEQAKSFERARIYNRFNSVLGPKQTYVKSPTDAVFDRGHLTPVADFLFINNKNATFKYINVVAQFTRINNGNWKLIEGWVRSQLNPQVPTLSVLTGVLDVLQLEDGNRNLVDMYLAPNENPIPKWMYKRVTDTNGNAVVFLTYNNIFGNIPPPRGNCKPVPCPIVLVANVTSGYTYCCDPRTF